MNERFCDLHTHSHYSDGSCAPAQLIHLAEEAGLSAVALTDHNTVAGLPEFMAAGEASPVRPIAGVEFSTDWGHTELHILALFLSREHYGPMEERLAHSRALKEESNAALAESLRAAGYPIDYDSVRARTGGVPNRAHFAAELVALGCCESIHRAIQTVLSPKNGLYTPPPHPDALETVAFIRSLGATAVLAHPFLNLTEPQLRAFLPQAIHAGLRGMEVLYSDYTPSQTEQARSIAREYGILESGGSDFHGSCKPHIPMGGGLGIPMELAEALEARLA